MPERINLGQGLVILGGVVLFVSLFLNWYQGPFGESVSAWTAFELLDIVLAGLAIVAVVTALPLDSSGALKRPSTEWLPWFGIAALVLMVITLLNDPPSVHGADIQAGAWVGLGGAILLALGGLLSNARVSLVVSSRGGGPTVDHEAETRVRDE